MLRLPRITPRSGRFLIALLLGVKLVLLVWNAAVFDAKPYDADYHADRALFGGLRPGKLAYDAPPYYLPALLLSRPADVPLVERSSEAMGEDEIPRATRSEKRHRDRLIALLRYSNVFWVGLFYLAWIYYAFPRLLVHFQPWFLASLLLLAMPGYQKLAVMSHPDNMFAGMASLAICCWLLLRERYGKARPAAGSPEEQAARGQAEQSQIDANAPGFSLLHLVGFALAIGVMALTRRFAVVPVAVLSLVAAAYVGRLVRWRWRPLLPRLLLITAIIGVLSTSWYVYRWQATGEVLGAQRGVDVVRQLEQRASFDYFQYYTSVRLRDLIEDPSREVGAGAGAAYANTPVASSFLTLLHSEIWGDQWLYFSGAKRDVKAWPKRLISTCALLVPLIVLALGVAYLVDLLRRARAQLRSTTGQGLVKRVAALVGALETDWVLLAISGLGTVLFICWQGGPALLPGNQSTVKFIYIATLFPPTLALLFRRDVKPLTFQLLSAYFLLLFLAALPFAQYWPK